MKTLMTLLLCSFVVFASGSKKVKPSIPKDFKAALKKDAQTLKSNHNFSAIIKENAKWPSHKITSSKNKVLDSTELHKSSPVVVSFFRGHW